MKHKILFVDDELNVLKSLKRLFVDTDYMIFTAESGEQGLEVCAKEEIALIISDYRMPGMNGVQFLTKVKEQFPRTIRIILSGYADVAAIVESINDGQVYKFLAKPWNDHELLTTVQRSFEHYTLQEENTALLEELRTANTELRKLTNSLERKVDDRTRDIELKNRALEIAQRLLNLLPAGVIGIDNQGTLVYMNRAMYDYVDVDQLILGEQLDNQLESVPLRALGQALNGQKTVHTVEDTDSGIRVICSVLPERVGVVGLFCFTDLNRHAQGSVNPELKDEVIHVD